MVNCKRQFNVIRPILGLVFFFLINSAFGVTDVAVIDTGFCPHSIDMTDSVKVNCDKISARDLETSPRFHGHWVVKTFTHYLGTEASNIKLHPLIVFNDKGEQTEAAWTKALDYIREKKIPIVLSATGFITKEKLSTTLPGVWFVSSGRAERLIKKNTALFPQMLAPKNNLFLIGDYQQEKNNSSIFYDQSLLYQENIDFYFPLSGPYQHVKGTSAAVAEALGRALKICPDHNSSADILRACLKKNQRILKDNILKKEMATF